MNRVTWQHRTTKEPAMPLRHHAHRRLFTMPSSIPYGSDLDMRKSPSDPDPNPPLRSGRKPCKATAEEQGDSLLTWEVRGAEESVENPRPSPRKVGLLCFLFFFAGFLCLFFVYFVCLCIFFHVFIFCGLCVFLCVFRALFVGFEGIYGMKWGWGWRLGLGLKTHLRPRTVNNENRPKISHPSRPPPPIPPPPLSLLYVAAPFLGQRSSRGCP